jgi:hypothetical protein
MKKYILIIVSIIISLQCNGQSQIKDKDFAKFADKFTELKLKSFPVKCKPTPNHFFYFIENPFHEISLEEAKKYLGYSDSEYYITIYDYDMDENKISNIRKVKNPPFANNKISQSNNVALIYLRSSSLYLNESDTAIEVLQTFTVDGKFVDKLVLQGYSSEFDWIDCIFMSNKALKIFHYLPNMENYNIKDEIYYIIDEKQPKTIVEIRDYQINDNGKINMVKTYPKQYLKEDVSFYRSYHENSDDPMNKYEY